MKKNRHHIASYPKEVLGIVVREDNFCIQFKEPSIKAVKNTQVEDGLIKLSNGDKALQVPVQEMIEIDTIGVRCYFPVLEQLEVALIDSYSKWLKTHKGEKYLLQREAFKKRLTYMSIMLDVILAREENEDIR